VAATLYPLLVRGARRRGEDEVVARRRFQPLIAIQFASFALVLVTGYLQMRSHGWSLAYPRWLALKIGIVAFVFVPLEAFLAYVAAFWIRPGLDAGPASRQLERGASMQGMAWAIALPLGVLALPVVLWLSLARPF
jgi:hypothetical protein